MRRELRRHQSAKVRGLRPSRPFTVSVRTPIVSARKMAMLSIRASASAGGVLHWGIEIGVPDPEIWSGEVQCDDRWL